MIPLNMKQGNDIPPGTVCAGINVNGELLMGCRNRKPSV